MKKAAAFIVALCVMYCCAAQTTVPRSNAELFDRLKSATTIEQKADIFFWLAWRYGNDLKIDSARFYCTNLKSISELKSYKTGMGKYCLAMAKIFFLTKDFKGSEKYTKMAIDVFSARNDFLYLGLAHKQQAYNHLGIFQKERQHLKAREHFHAAIHCLSRVPVSSELARSYYELGYSFLNTYEIDSAALYLVTSNRLAEKTGSPFAMFRSCLMLGKLYMSVNEWDKAYGYLANALRVQPPLLDKIVLRECLGNFAICLIEKKEFRQADSIVTQYAAMNDALGDSFGQINLLHIKGRYAAGQDNYHIAFEFLQKAFDRLEEIKNTLSDVMDITYQLACAELKTGRTKKAIEHFRTAASLAVENKSGLYKMKTHYELSKAFEAAGSLDSAYANFRLYANYKDSLLSFQKQKAVVEAIAEYESEKQAQQIKLLQNEKQLQAALAARESQRKKFAYIAIAAILLFGGYASFRYVQHKRLSGQLAVSLKELKQTQEQLIKIETEKEAENIRSRISRDIHDEVGATLSGVALFSEIAKLKMAEHNDADVRKYLDHISVNSKEMIEKVSDIVWAINPENDSFGRVMSKLQALAFNLCAGKNIRLHMNIDKAILDEHPEMKTRRNIYLFVKEAINNSVKYSGGRNLFFSLQKQYDHIVAEVRDDGSGFDTTLNKGNGLNNMRIRAEELNGSFTLDTQPGLGTTIRLQFNYHPGGGHRKVV